VSAIALATPVGVALVAWILVGLPLGVLPGSDRNEAGATEWGPLEVASGDRNVVRDWARWNYSGYERKAAFPEYAGLIEMMGDIAADPELGCGRAMWEYENDRLNTYGTPMAPMLLPFWTDGCIGSMEGLYFEASSTTPYHFLNQRALSANCSCAQRDLPYGSGFDIDLGVDQLQTMGVRYYLAFSDLAVNAANANPELTEVGTSGPWHAYLVPDSELVEPLANEPAVLTGLEPGMAWVGPASKWFMNPNLWDVALAADGPDEWQRVPVCTSPEKAGSSQTGHVPGWATLDVCTSPEARPLPSITVSGIETTDDGVSFDVSEPGVPVVVKASYFPNWEAKGAEGPYRITPNLMVVIPTDTHVELTYGWTGLDLGAYGLSLLGIVGAVVLHRRPMLDPDGVIWLDGPDTVVLAPDSVAPATESDAEADEWGDDEADDEWDDVSDDDGRWRPEAERTDDER
jgi:hypothetical protein